MPHMRNEEQTKREKYTVRVTRRVAFRIDRAARAKGVTPTEFMRLAALRAVELAERNGAAIEGGGGNNA